MAPVALGVRENVGSGNWQPNLTDAEGAGSLFSGAFPPKVLGTSRGAKLGSNSGGMIVSLKRGTKLGGDSGGVTFSLKRGTHLVSLPSPPLESF